MNLPFRYYLKFSEILFKITYFLTLVNCNMAIDLVNDKKI
jgi:hypothetical protein